MESKAEDGADFERKVRARRSGVANAVNPLASLSVNEYGHVLGFLDLADIGSIAAASPADLAAVKSHLRVRRHLRISNDIADDSDTDSHVGTYNRTAAAAFRLAVESCVSLQRLDITPCPAVWRYASVYARLVHANRHTLRAVASFQVCQNPVSDCFPLPVLQALRQCEQLEEFRATPEVGGDTSRTELFAQVFLLPKLRSLVVDGQSMSRDHTPVSWLTSVSKAVNLTHLTFFVTSISHLERLASAQLPQTLTSLELSVFDDHFQIDVPPYYTVLSKFKQLTALSLQWGRKRFDPDAIDLSVAGDAVLALPRLTELTVPRNLCGEGSLQVECPELRRLDASCRIGLSWFARALAACQKLEVVRHGLLDDGGEMGKLPLRNQPASDAKWTCFPATLRELSMPRVPLLATALQALAAAQKLEIVSICVDSSVRPSHLRALLSELKLVTDFTAEIDAPSFELASEDKCDTSPTELPLLRRLSLALFSDGLFRNLSTPKLELLTLGRNKGIGCSTLSDISGFLESLRLPVHLKLANINPTFLSKVSQPIPVKTLQLVSAGTGDQFGRGEIAVEVMAAILQRLPMLSHLNMDNSLDLLVVLQHQPSIGQQLRGLHLGTASVSDLVALLPLLPRLEVIQLSERLWHRAEAVLVHMASKLPCLANGRTVRLKISPDREDQDGFVLSSDILLGAAHPLSEWESLVISSSAYAGTEPAK